MWNFIERLRQKPESYRKRFAFISAGAITGVIFLIWVTTLPFTIRNVQEKTAERANDAEHEVSPLEAARENFGAAFEGMKEQFQGFQEEFQNAQSDGEMSSTSADSGFNQSQ